MSVHDRQSTAYSILVNPATGSYQTFVRWDGPKTGVSDGRRFAEAAQWLHKE